MVLERSKRREPCRLRPLVDAGAALLYRDEYDRYLQGKLFWDALFGVPYPKVLRFLLALLFAAIAMQFAVLQLGIGIAFVLLVTSVPLVRACF